MNDRRDDEFEGRDADIACAFCGKQPHQVAAMISGPNGIYICDECISVCADAMMRDLGLSVPGHDEAAMAEGFSHAEEGRHARVGDGVVTASVADPAPEDVLAGAETALERPHVRVRGLMTIPPADAERDANFRYFQEVQALYVDMNKKLFHNELEYLSMGMSGDYEDAIRAGATMVRVGSAIFGARHYN